jgi:hypothetical protein
MAEENVLLRVGIDQSQIEGSITAIQEARKEMQALKIANKELADSEGNTSKAFIENEAAMRQLNQTIKENERVLVNSQKILKSNEGSIVGMRESVKRLTTEYTNLSAAERKSAQGQDLAKKIKAQNDELLKLEGTLGDFKRNVGNYPQVMGKAVGATDTFGGSAVRLFDVIKANPIVFLVTALVGLISKVSESQAAMDLFNKVITPINVAFQKLVGLIQEGAGPAFDALAEAVSNPIETLKELGNIIVENVINRFKALALFGPAIAKIFKGDVVSGFKDLGNAALQLGTGVEDVIGKVGNAVTAIGNFISDAIDEGNKLNQLNKDIELQEAAIALQAAKLNRQITERKTALEDLNATEKERVKAGREALGLIDEESRLQQKLLELKIAKAQQEASFNDTDRKAQIELNKLIAERDELEAKRLKDRKEVLTKVAGLEKAEAAKAEAERKRLQDEENKRFKKQLEDAAKAVEASLTKRINDEKERFIQGEIDYKAYQDNLASIDQAAFDVRIAAEEAALAEIRANKEIDNATRLQLEADYLAQLGEVRQGALDFEVESTKKAADEKAAQEALVAQAKQKLLQEGLNTLIQVLGAESDAGKAVATFQTLLNTYQSATASYKSLAGIPVVGPALGFAAAALATVSGLLQVQKINSTPKPAVSAPKVGTVKRTFADGGDIDIGGNLHSAGGTTFTGTDGTAFEAEKGEKLFVVNRQSSALLNALQTVNDYGKRNRSTMRRNYFADGGFVSRGASGGAVSQSAQGANINFAKDVADSVGNLSVVARISEINKVDSDLNKAISVSEL